jgi:hypothetical protein
MRVAVQVTWREHQRRRGLIRARFLLAVARAPRRVEHVAGAVTRWLVIILL